MWPPIKAANHAEVVLFQDKREYVKVQDKREYVKGR
jgi:hypothetical protein